MRGNAAIGALNHSSSAADSLSLLEQRAMRQIRMINQLAVDRDYARGDLTTSLSIIARLLPAAFAVSRVSIWKLADSGSAVKCLVVSDLVPARQEAESLPAEISCSHYVLALTERIVIATADVGAQSLYDDFNEVYHKRECIASSLDAGIIVDNRLVGIIKIEHQSSIRNWYSDEIAFARTVALMAAQVFCRSNLSACNEQLLAAKLSAENASIAKSQFLASMSHEIRTPMNGVLGIADLLSHTCKDEKQREMISLLIQSGKRMMSVINEILDISRIEAGKLTICKELMNIREVIFSALTPLSFEAQRKNLPLNIFCSPEVPEVVTGDQARIAQILINLVGNAIKFTEDGNISVLCDLLEVKEGYARLRFEVSDTGIGIPQQHLQNLFAPFYQVDRSVSKVTNGAGLGLPISRRLAHLMGGTIDVRSVEAEGTTVLFEIKLEIAEFQIPDQEPEETAYREASDLHAKILVVEDDSVSSYLAVSILEELGLKADTAKNGQEAISKLKECRYDMILMDCCLPVMDGFEASRLIRQGGAGEEAKNIPIIALTACAMKGDQERCLANGMNGYISKPVEFLQIAALIKGCLSSKTIANDPVRARIKK